MIRKPNQFGPFDISQTGSLTGLTTYMLDYLCRTGVWPPSLGRPGRGKDRLYSFGDIVVLRTLKQLLKRGVSVARLKRSFAVLRTSGVSITATSPVTRYLVTDGVNVYLRDNGSLEELTPRRQLAFAFVIKLEQLRGNLVVELRKSA